MAGRQVPALLALGTTRPMRVACPTPCLRTWFCPWAGLWRRVRWSPSLIGRMSLLGYTFCSWQDVVRWALLEGFGCLARCVWCPTSGRMPCRWPLGPCKCRRVWPRGFRGALQGAQPALAGHRDAPPLGVQAYRPWCPGFDPDSGPCFWSLIKACAGTWHRVGQERRSAGGEVDFCRCAKGALRKVSRASGGG